MFKCEYCEREFTTKSGYTLHIKHKTCCKNECKKCGKLTGNAKYCSQTCAGFGQPSKVIKLNQCLNCGKPVRNKYCNSKCQGDKDYKIKVEKWLAGEIDGRTKFGPSGFIKRYLIETYGEKCMECGWAERNQYSGNIPIELEHIDGDSENNEPENLICLCVKCHSKVKNQDKRLYYIEYFMNKIEEKMSA